MITYEESYYKYNEDGSIDVERTCESYIDYLSNISQESTSSISEDEDNSNKKAYIYVALTTPSNKHWYELPIAKAQGGFYSHAGLTFDEKMGTLYNVRAKGLIITRRNEFIKEKISIDIYEYEISERQKRRIRNIVNKFVTSASTAYDFLMIGKLLIKIIFKIETKEGQKNIKENDIIERGRYICSGWVAGILAATVKKFRMYLIQNHIKWTSFMPEDFIKIPGMQLIKRIVFPDNKTIIKFK
jgi:hypothetical protein